MFCDKQFVEVVKLFLPFGQIGRTRHTWRREASYGRGRAFRPTVGVREMVVWIVLIFLQYVFMLRTSDLVTGENQGSHKICRLRRGGVLSFRDGQGRREV